MDHDWELQVTPTLLYNLYVPGRKAKADPTWDVDEAEPCSKDQGQQA